MKTNKYFKTFFINKKSQTSNPTSKKASIKQPIQRINPKQKKETKPIEHHNLDIEPFVRVTYPAPTDFELQEINEIDSLSKTLFQTLSEYYHEALKGNRNLEIGNIPKEIPSSDLTQIVDYLSKQMEYGVKNKKKIESLTIGYRKYDFAYFTEGKSDKNVFGLFTPEGKKYVLKMSTPERRSLDNPFALGTLAKIDSYLTYNRSRNSAPLCYYNHEKNFSIYKYIEHIQTPDCQHDLTKVAKNMPDFYALGLTYNDTVGNKNFFLLNNESNADLVKTVGFQEGVNRGEWVSVDNDHVTYANRMQPMLTKYHSYLPNVMQMCV